MTDPEDFPEPVWKFRGYELKPGDFNTAMVHLYRGEVQRMNVWRQRLDATTNWAVVTTGAAITFAFNQNSGHHGVIILNTLLVTIFLSIEARRYRYYELWAYRVRLLETDFFTSMLVPPFRPAPDWAESLAESMLHPQFPISFLEAFGRRFRRNYLWIYLIMGLAWLGKIWLLPEPSVTLEEFIGRASIGTLSGWFVIGMGLAYNGTLLLIGLLSRSLQEATGEVLSQFEGFEDFASDKGTGAKSPGRVWFRRSRPRRQVVALIITEQGEQVGGRILESMKRGVTALEGTGQYTHAKKAVLLCALTITEIPQLKALVRENDPKAFVVVMPAEEILGSGFFPMAENA